VGPPQPSTAAQSLALRRLRSRRRDTSLDARATEVGDDPDHWSPPRSLPTPIYSLPVSVSLTSGPHLLGRAHARAMHGVRPRPLTCGPVGQPPRPFPRALASNLDHPFPIRWARSPDTSSHTGILLKRSTASRISTRHPQPLQLSP
jgi:hypothetical protein